MPSRIEDYALIGDCHTGALVAKDGSIDWLCLPRFDSGACFASLLGNSEHGRWRIAPVGEVQEIRRRYRHGTLILETDFRTSEGEVTVIDFMPPRTNAVDLIRIVRGKKGRVPMQMEVIFRFDYGSIVPWLRKTDFGLRAVAGPDTVLLHTDVPLRGENFTTKAEFSISAGEERNFLLGWHPSHEPDEECRTCEDALQETNSWWREWSDRCTYKGFYKDAVTRSLITLKALTYAPTGGIVAAATTSLPEQLGGMRNWDYRFCWLRDATFTLYSLLMGGYVQEACAWREWLLRAVAGKPSQLNIMYGLAGERRLPEIQLDWLPGYESSSPVRTGNAACNQFQLDVFGEVMDTLHLARRRGLEPEENAWRLQRALIDYLESVWTNPDEGIWEVRGPRRHFTHSKVMAWVAVDRMIKSVESFSLLGPVEQWKQLRQKIHKEVCEQGFNTELNAFVHFYDSKDLDASLLMIPLVGFLPAHDSRLKGTVKAIEDHLNRDGFIQRYTTRTEVDGLPPGEGAFLPCSFWLADNYALQGEKNKARDLFEKLLDLRNDVGLLSEEYDPGTQRLLGNFPQAFSHVGLINSACNLSQSQGPGEERQES